MPAPCSSPGLAAERFHLVEVDIGDRRLVLGARLPDRPAAALRADRSTLMRLISGRPAVPADYELAGATPEELVVF